MLKYLIDNIFVEFGERIFQQTIGIPMGTYCALLLADLFLYSYEAEFVQKKSKRKVKGEPQSQTAALPRHQEEEETGKSKLAQIEQIYEKH